MKSRMIGAILLITGCCIGAGMLGLPVVSALTGFIPSTILFFIIWLFMLTTGLLVLEVNLWFHDDVSFMTMAERTLGTTGKIICGFLFLFLFYCLMVAYISGGGGLFSDLFDIPKWLGSILTTVVLGTFIFISTEAVDKVNRLFMLGLAVTYILLLAIGVSHVDLNLLRHQDWNYSYLAIPVMVISFGFHNLVPSMVSYLDRDKNKIRFTIVLGSAIPLLIYLFFDGLIMGLISVDGAKAAILQGDMATRVLRTATHSTLVVDIADYFALFAIVTSFLGVALSLVDFLADGMQMNKRRRERFILTFLALGPPLLFGLIYPNLFLWALGIAGGFSAVILFGILPALMVWKGRYSQGLVDNQLVFGGKSVLVVVILISTGIVISQIVQELAGV